MSFHWCQTHRRVSVLSLCYLSSTNGKDCVACDLIFLRQRFHLERLNATSFVSFTNSSVTGVSTCQGRQTQVGFLGLQHFSFDPGCVLSVAGVTFVSASNRSVIVQYVVSLFPANFSLFDNETSLVSDILTALSSSEKINLSALVRGDGVGIEVSVSLGPDILSHGGFLGRFRLGHLCALHPAGFRLGTSLADLPVHCQRVRGGGSVSRPPFSGGTAQSGARSGSELPNE